MSNEVTVGRIVHFFDDTGHGPLAAIVTKVHSGTMVNLNVQGDGDRYPSPVYGVTSISFEENAVKQKRWCWPPRS